jgi:hypothetical protein
MTTFVATLAQAGQSPPPKEWPGFVPQTTSTEIFPSLMSPTSSAMCPNVPASTF